jgi:hypothetical protein
VPIPPQIIADWQRFCLQYPDGELVVDTADGAELLKAYADLQAAYEGHVEQAAGVGICMKLPHHWQPGDRVRAVKLHGASNVTPIHPRK